MDGQEVRNHKTTSKQFKPSQICWSKSIFTSPIKSLRNQDTKTSVKSVFLERSDMVILL